MAPQATLTGAVRDAAGAPVPGATISAYNVRDALPAGSGVSNADGRYSIAGLERRRTYSIAIEVGAGRQEAGRVRLTKAETTFDISLPLGGPVHTDTTTSVTSETTSATTSSTDTTSTDTTSTDTTSSDTTSSDTTSTDTTSTDTTSTDTTSTNTTSTDTTSTSTDTTSTSTDTTSTSTDSTSTSVTVEPSFALLEARLATDQFAAQPKVNIAEARELSRLFVVSMFLTAGVPESINRLFTETRPTYQVGDLTLQGMDQQEEDVRVAMRSIVDRRTQPFDTEQAILEEIRAGLDLGTAAVPSVNADFKLLYRELATLAADPNNGVDPDVVEKQEAAQAAVIYNFLITLKRAILRLTQNMSVYGTRGTERLVEKWSGIVNDGLFVLDKVGTGKVVSADQDDKAAWSVLAALSGSPRSTVKAYVVNAHSGGQLLKLAIGAYEKMQGPPSLLDDDSPKTLRDLFIVSRDVEPAENKSLSDLLKSEAVVIRDHLDPLWP